MGEVMDAADYEERVLSILRRRKGWDEQYSSIAEFKEHLNEAGLADEKLNHGWVMWRENERYEQQQLHLYHSHYVLQHKIKTLLKHITSEFMFNDSHSLVQFWGVVKVEGHHHYLSTSNYPFCFDSSVSKGVSWYRKLCMDRILMVDVDAAEAEQLGGVERAYRNKHPETTPDLRLYSTNEFSLRDEAARCGFIGYMALPIFDLHTQECYGVLELLSRTNDMEMPPYEFFSLNNKLEAADLSSSLVDLRPRFKVNDVSANIKKALTEVEDVFELIDNIPQVYSAKVWIPDEECASINSNVRYVELALFTEEIWKDMCANEVHWIMYVQPKKGMIGMVLESENKSCFCRNLSEFSIADHPLALVERKKRIDVCFAICLQSSHTGDLLYVLEFFLIPGLSHLQSFFNFLLPILKQQLPSFKYSSGKQIGEELVVEVIEFYEANNPAFSELGQLDVFPIKFKRVQYGQLMEHQQAEDEPVRCVSDARQTEQGNTVASDFKKTNRGKRETGLHLSLEDIKQHFGKKQKDAAKDMCVGLSTLKRRCRDFHIFRWPNKKKHMGNPTLYQRENREHSQQDMQPSSSRNLGLLEIPLHQSMPHTHTESTQHHIVQEEAENVIIKVKFEEDNIKFELCLSLGLPKLFEEVTMRLKLEMGTFKLKYLDEDDDEILLACDADLQYCSKTQKRMGKTYIQLFVR